MEQTKYEILSALDFGQRVAEEEGDALSTYFVETDDWRRLFSGTIDIVYGSKGAGKSALYALMLARKDELLDRRIALAPAENPRGAPAFRDIVSDPPLTEVEFVGVWKLYLCAILNDILEQQNLSEPTARELRVVLESEGLVKREKNLRGLLRAVQDYAARLLRVEAFETGLDLDPVTGSPTGLKGRISFQEPTSGQRGAGVYSIDHLLEIANEALRQGEHSAWILLDRLDVAFAEHEELEQNALRALFKVYLDLLAYERIRLKIFLRTDIWQRITEAGFREASHITRHLTIRWDRRTLLNLVVRRAAQNGALLELCCLTQSEALETLASQEAFFYRWSPRQVEVGPNKADTFDWILGRTKDGTGLNAPRELVHLLGVLKEVQLRRLETGDDEPEGTEIFVRPAYKEALVEVSRVRLEQTLYAEYPSLRPYIEKLEGEKTSQTSSSLARIWSADSHDSSRVAQQLLDVGFFEARGTKESPEFWVPFLYRDALGMVQGSAE